MPGNALYDQLYYLLVYFRLFIGFFIGFFYRLFKQNKLKGISDFHKLRIRKTISI